MALRKQPRDTYIAQLLRFSYVWEEDLDVLLHECKVYGIKTEDTRDYDGCITFEELGHCVEVRGEDE